MVKNKQYAPVFIPTLNRYDHFKRCLESLEQCTGAEMTDVYIGLDYPPSEKYVEGWEKIDLFLKEKENHNGFKNLIVRRRDHNCGVGTPNSNARLLRQEVESYYSFYIYSEDDNVFSPNFLEYMNYYLNVYEDDDSIISISGYSFPIDYSNYTEAVFKTYCYSPWGYGRWTHKNNVPDLSSCIDEYILSNDKMIQLYKNARWLFDLVISMRYQGLCYPDEANRTRNLLEGYYSIAPVTSKVRNMGYDNTGINCATDNGAHATQRIDDSIIFEGGELIEIKGLNKKYQRYFDKGIINDIKAIVKYIFLRKKLKGREYE